MSSSPQQTTSTVRNGSSESNKVTSPKTHSKPPQPQHYNKPRDQSNGPHPQQKVSRRSSKPIINWFQRKLAGHGKTKAGGISQGGRNESAAGKGRPGGLASSRVSTRVTSSPLPVPQTSQRGTTGRQSTKSDIQAIRRKTISLNEDVLLRGDDDYLSSDDDSSSIARGSAWSPASALEADEDASLRPLPPSAPPSPSPSRESSSYLSDPRTFRSIAASTKPTTVLSLDLAPGGMAHIAQVPATPQMARTSIPPHVRTGSSATPPVVLGSGASITFSALPPSPQSSSRPSSLRDSENVNAAQRPSTGQYPNVLQAPLHTSHHPRNNPRPSSPPLDNASVLTLASSAFAFPGARPPVSMGWASTSPSARVYGDSVSHFGGSMLGEGYLDPENTSQFLLGEDDRPEERDGAASMRALRPRSSRRGSWESDQVSVWSAKGGVGGSSLARQMSVWTSNSGQGFPTNEEVGELVEGSTDHESTEVVSSNAPDSLELSHSYDQEEGGSEKKDEDDIRNTTITQLAPDNAEGNAEEPGNEEEPAATPNGSRAAQLEGEPKTPVEQDDSQSVLVDIWHSAPSTPLPLPSAGLQ